MNPEKHSVMVISDSLSRKNLIKSSFLISQKRPIWFVMEEGRLQKDTHILLCDITTVESLVAAGKAIRERRQQGGSLSVVYLYDFLVGQEASRDLVRRSGLESSWETALTLDSKSNWAKVLGVLELAVKRQESPTLSNSVAETSEPAPSLPPTKVLDSSPGPLVSMIDRSGRAPSLSGLHPSGSGPSERQKAISVLLVDDSQSAREFVIQKLRSTWDRDFAFDLAQTGGEAKQKCLDKKYDILFLDVTLPDLDGYAVCKSLKNTKNADSLAVMLTSKSGTFDKLKGMMSGCDMYLVKPLDEAQIKSVAKKFSGL